MPKLKKNPLVGAAPPQGEVPCSGQPPLKHESQLEARVQHWGRHVLAQMGTNTFKNWWFEKVLDASMQNSHFKTQMFRFVDVFASLQTGDEMMRHLHEYLAQDGRLPPWLQMGHKLGSLLPQVAARVLKKNMQSMAKVFIAGETPQHITPYLKALHARKIGFTVDILDEATLSEHEAARNQQAYLNLISNLAQQQWPRQPQIDTCHLGAWPVAQVSIKLSSLYSQIHPHAFEHSVHILKQKVRPIFQLAQKNKVLVNIDMERYAHKNITLQVFCDLLQEPEFCNTPYFSIVVQTYLREALADLKTLLHVAQRRGTPLGIRLVKGAYWDYESIYAQQQTWPSPVWLHKAETDLCFEQALALLVGQPLHLAVASHNVRSLAVAMALVEQRGVPKNSIEFQMLYGMAQSLKPALLKEGWRVREYVTMGQAIPGMAYLVRRLLENTSNEGFIKSISKKHGADRLLARPLLKNQPTQSQQTRSTQTRSTRNTLNKGDTMPHLSEPAHTQVPHKHAASKHAPSNLAANPQLQTFNNEALLDWNIESHRRHMQHALSEFKFGQFYSLRKGQNEWPTELGVPPTIKEPEAKASDDALSTAPDLESSDTYIVRRNPSNTQQIVGVVEAATEEQADQAVQHANAAHPLWQSLPAGQRCRALNTLADELLRRRFELMACIILESGKSWPEADGDVCEAIDFCRYYARQMQQFAYGQQVSPVPGEDSRLYYEAYGVSVVIAPWNFPLAILTGMTAASLVTGHAVIMKPAEQSSVIAFKLYEAWQSVRSQMATPAPPTQRDTAQADTVAAASSFEIPHHVLQLLPGYGHRVGQHLSRHPDVHLVNFTGSREVGLQILQHLATPTHIKQAVVEMGGKNAIIIDDDADVDEAVAGVLHSAFGFQGQKCSACSRVIVLARVWDVFLQRFIEATRSLQQGPSAEPKFQLGPVVDQEAYDRLRQTLEGYKLPLAYQGPWLQGGYFIPPTIFAPVPAEHEIVQHELFGPVVAMLKAENLNEAIGLANRSQYALTGGVYSRSPSNIDRVRRELKVGNLYINREITGAIVGRHPFGGHKMSGLGDKAGGPHTLLQYMRGRVITENTVRRGFTPA